jgi:RimJ/RimL family protein N-acetyltransferase
MRRAEQDRRADAMKCIETERLRLRDLRETDFPAYAAMCADPEVMKYLGGTLSAEDAWRQLAMLVGHWALRGFGMWAVETREGELAGRVGLHFPHGWPDRELGWALVRTHWGRGYALEAATAARDYAFATSGGRAWSATCTPRTRGRFVWRNASVRGRLVPWTFAAIACWCSPIRRITVVPANVVWPYRVSF